MSHFNRDKGGCKLSRSCKKYNGHQKPLCCTDNYHEDVQALGQIILECLEPSTFLKEGKSLLKDWHSHVSNFVESTKLEANEGMVSKFHEIPGSHFHLVAAGIQYCGFQEGGPLRGRRKRSAPSDNDDVVPSPPARKIKPDTPPTTSWENERTTGREHIPNAEQTFACFQCPKTYSDYNGVKRHFRKSHLTDRTCNFCDLSVLHEMHLRRHAEVVHGLRT
jgi:hypothetical protein